MTTPYEPAPFEEIVGHVQAGRLDLEAWSSALPWAAVERFLSEGERALRELPVPIGASIGGPAVERRRAIERLVGRLRARRGDYDAFVEAERSAWLRGGSHVTYVRALREAGRTTEAAVLCRTLLAEEDCAEREQLEEFLASLASPPEGWESAVAEFARDPSAERWEELWRFTPEDLLDERVRYTLSLLRRLGVDPETLFHLATWRGVVPDAVELVESGLVSPQVVERRAERSTPTGRPVWLGLAARAALVRGDRLGTVRLLKAAFETHHPESRPVHDLEFVREHADEELHDMLDRAGLPR